MRRLPVYIVVDISESMAGENLRQMQEGISAWLINFAVILTRWNLFIFL